MSEEFLLNKSISVFYGLRFLEVELLSVSDRNSEVRLSIAAS
jgi:hypothetical protein